MKICSVILPYNLTFMMPCYIKTLHTSVTRVPDMY